MEISGIISSYSRPAARVQALPPQYQEAREKESIQNDPRLAQLLGDAAILEIRKVEGGYIVMTESNEMKVDVHYLLPEKPICGPAQFELFFHRPASRYL